MLKVYNIGILTRYPKINLVDKKGILLMHLKREDHDTVNFQGKMQDCEIGLSETELAKRTHKDYLRTITLLRPESAEFQSLASGDKISLQSLVRAAYILDNVYLKQDSEENISFKDAMKQQAKRGDKKAKMVLKLFYAQKGINAVDSEGKKFSLMKGKSENPGKAFYPENLSKEEFHQILIKMLEEGKINEVTTILNQRSMVVRNGNELKAIDFTEAFKSEFTKAAKELNIAAEYSTNKDFSEFLQLQAKALMENNPMTDAYADKKWAALQDTPLEFTITRESYEDEMTGTVVENEKLSKLLEKHNITPMSKDSIGVRVGIVNKEGTSRLLEIKKYFPELAKEMPFANAYKKLDDAVGKEKSICPQTMVDVDLVALTGDVGSYRGGITLAQNLPNRDKLSLTIGGGRRNVYHRQIRDVSDLKKLKQTLNATLDKELHQFYENEANHWFTIGHENAHALGPRTGTELGKYRHIIEENKADMVAIAMLDKLVELGMYTEFQKKQILITFIVNSTLKAKPSLNQPHRVRTVMQFNYFLKNGAVYIDKNGIIHINYDKIIPTARKMLEEIISVQLSGDFAKAEKYVLDNFVWAVGMIKIAKKLKIINKTLNGTLNTQLANRLLRVL